jgi:hypothetical protein
MDREDCPHGPSGIHRCRSSARQQYLRIERPRPPAALALKTQVPERGTGAPPYSSPLAGYQVRPWSTMARPSTSTRASMAGDHRWCSADRRRGGGGSLFVHGARNGGRRWGSLFRPVHLLRERPGVEWMMRAVPELEARGGGGGEEVRKRETDRENGDQRGAGGR